MAHNLTHWQPAGEEPVLFTSPKSAFQTSKAIRGGVPVIFPWFGDRHDGQAGPAHGLRGRRSGSSDLRRCGR